MILQSDLMFLLTRCNKYSVEEKFPVIPLQNRFVENGKLAGPITYYTKFEYIHETR